jgi:DNA-binding MarR family transcriptional regulator
MKLTEDNFGFLLADVSRQLRRAFEHEFRDSSLTQAQARVLVYVLRNEGIRQVQLAELLDVQPITLARLIDQLAAAGMVERRADPTDRRAYLIHLSRVAKPHLLAIEKAAATVRADALRGIDSKQAEKAFSILRRMRDNLAAR